MIKLSLWDRLYTNTFDWVLRRLDPECLKLYKDTEKDWLEAVLAFDKFQKELFENYAVLYKSGDKHKRKCVKGLELNGQQLFELTHKHLANYTNHTIRYFIFHWWNDLRCYIEDGRPSWNPHDLYKLATKEEIEQARKDFSHSEEIDWHGVKHEHDHTFSDDAKVLAYREVRLIIDNEWGYAWFKAKDGRVKSFRLDWDWWYPIDEFLDLCNI